MELSGRAGDTFVRLNAKPDFSYFPRLSFEFEGEAGWFPVNRLPTPVHPFVWSLAGRLSANGG